MIVEFFNGFSFTIGAVVGVVVCIVTAVGLANLYDAISEFMK